MYNKLLLLLATGLFCSCSPTHKLNRSAEHDLLHSTALQSAHTGIIIYEPVSGKYLLNLQGDKYFVPASNTKLATCYAAMKYLGDSLVSLNYLETEDTLFIRPAGDPTFLNAEYRDQKPWDFLKAGKKITVLDADSWKEERWGTGWSWDDYKETDMAERSILPMYGNLVSIKGPFDSLRVLPNFFSTFVSPGNRTTGKYFPSSVHRDMEENHFTLSGNSTKDNNLAIPYYTGNGIIPRLLQDTLNRPVYLGHGPAGKYTTLHSQPVDSLLKPMMHRSDNFFAEQSLLMVSSKLLGVMNDRKIIDTLLRSDYKDLPQPPRWVDGSGLSRYNLFTPHDLVMILDMMSKDFGMERLKTILATGREGTLTNYYRNIPGFIYAKTGTLSGVVALSGFLYTKRNRLLEFSVLVNNNQAPASAVRRAVESFLEGIREKY